MRNTWFQTFFGQLAWFPNILNHISHFMIIVMMKKKTLIFITREAFLGNQPHISTTFADFPLCFWAPLQDISRVFGTFLLRYPTSKFDHFRRIRDARAAAADSKTTMISWFIKSSSSSSPLRTGTGKKIFWTFPMWETGWNVLLCDDESKKRFHQKEKWPPQQNRNPQRNGLKCVVMWRW